jgi:hypothetical protein
MQTGLSIVVGLAQGIAANRHRATDVDREVTIDADLRYQAALSEQSGVGTGDALRGQRTRPHERQQQQSANQPHDMFPFGCSQITSSSFRMISTDFGAVIRIRA